MPNLVDAIHRPRYEPAWQCRVPFRYWRLWDASCKELQSPYCSQENALFLTGAFQHVRLAAALYFRQL